MKPIPRSALRIRLGKAYYTSKRYVEWIFGKDKFAKQKLHKPYPFMIYQHRTPLLRQLKDVDMWLQYNKIKNLQIAIDRLNGMIIQPGETLSYWRTIGKPTKRKGYVEGMVLFYGSFKAGIGGGLCQLSNLIYWMTLHTPLRVTERHRHSYDVFPDANRTQPFGSGATCAYNYLDLRVYNPTQQPFQLCLYLTDRDLVGEWRSTMKAVSSYEVYEKEHRITKEHWGGYMRHNTVFRRVYNLEGRLIDDQYITENHAIMMYAPFIEDKGHTFNVKSEQ